MKELNQNSARLSFNPRPALDEAEPRDGKRFRYRLGNRRKFIQQSTCGWLSSIFLNSALADSPFLEPPAEFGEPDPTLRSPLVFRDGRPVKTADDWLRRRREIRDEWFGIIGEWPPLIDRPEIELVETTRREGIEQRRIRLQIALNQTADAYLLIPTGSGPFPAVFVPFYDPETSVGLKAEKPFRDFAWQLAKRGFVGLAVGSPGGDARKPVLASNATCQPLAYLGYISANAWQALASLPEVDQKRIAIVGHSYGGKWAMFGACLSDRYACAVWSDPGIVFDETRISINYQEPWYLGYEPNATRKPGLVSETNPRTGAYAKLIAAGHDLHELHALMAPRPFLVSGGAEDPPKRWSALQHAIAVNRLLGYHDRVAMTNRGEHAPNEASNEQIYRFLESRLKQ